MRWIAVGLVVASCGYDTVSNDPYVPPDGPPALAGGTLHVTSDGTYAIASDPDRSSIHVVDLDAGSELSRIVLDPNDEPGRITEDLEGRVYVVLRRAGDVLTIDPASARILARRHVCTMPRGIDLDRTTDQLVVACAEGALVWLPAGDGPPSRTVTVPPDVRDVVTHSSGRMFVSIFRTAEVLILENDAIVQRVRPPLQLEDPLTFPPTFARTPNTAWRMRPHPDGALLVYQESVSSALSDFASISPAYYGDSAECGSVVRSAVGIVSVDGTWRVGSIQAAPLAVDAIHSMRKRSIYVAAASEPGVPSDEGTLGLSGVRTMSDVELNAVPGCRTTDGAFEQGGPAVALGISANDDRIVAQFRDPPLLAVHDRLSPIRTIALSGGAVEHIGYALFHEGTPSGVACASCHPEGGDDGQVWQFDAGPRRSQTLRGGILETAPFHWGGDIPDITSVMDGTFVGRMAGLTPLDEEIERFAHWVAPLPALGPANVDPAMAERGQVLFDQKGCNDCHAGPRRTNNLTVNVATGGRFQVPGLYEVVHHAPYFHDGSAPTLEDVLTNHGESATLTDAERTDLAAYLRSL